MKKKTVNSYIPLNNEYLWMTYEPKELNEEDIEMTLSAFDASEVKGSCTLKHVRYTNVQTQTTI